MPKAHDQGLVPLQRGEEDVLHADLGLPILLADGHDDGLEYLGRHVLLVAHLRVRAVAAPEAYS